MFREQGYLFLLLTRSNLRARRLLAAAREALNVEDRAVVAHRYSTETRMRPYVVGLGEPEFAARDEFGCFSLSWESLGARHAVGIEIDRWMDGGLNVLVHAHRKALEPARQRYGARLRVVLAPIPNSASNWEELFREWQRQQKQFPLALSLDEEPIAGAESTALLLPEQLEAAREQLIEVVRQQTPPLGSDEPEPSGERHAIV